MERYRARLVVKWYAQKEGIDLNEIFSPVVRLTTVRVVLTMCITFDLHLDHLNVKTAFLLFIVVIIWKTKPPILLLSLYGR